MTEFCGQPAAFPESQ